MPSRACEQNDKDCSKECMFARFSLDLSTATYHGPPVVLTVTRMLQVPFLNYHKPYRSEVEHPSQCSFSHIRNRSSDARSSFLCELGHTNQYASRTMSLSSRNFYVTSLSNSSDSSNHSEQPHNALVSQLVFQTKTIALFTPHIFYRHFIY